eukprot:4168720-Heterocapsa_arctica.AAC.1
MGKAKQIQATKRENNNTKSESNFQAVQDNIPSSKDKCVVTDMIRLFQCKIDFNKKEHRAREELDNKEEKRNKRAKTHSDDVAM